MKTLIVEDDPATSTVLQAVVSSLGYSVTCCDNAESAWEEYKKHAHKLILLDITLPGKDGLEFCRQLRSYPGGDLSVVLVITARNKLKDLKDILGSGADDYLSKPVDTKMLKIRLAIAEKMVNDIKERKKIEEALTDNAEYFRSLIDMSLDVVTILDPKGVILYTSAALVNILGYEANELINKNLSEFIDPKDLPVLTEAINIGNKNPIAHPSIELNFQCKDSSVHVLEIRGSFLYDDSGISRFIINARDITERKVIENKLKDSHDKLETSVKESELKFHAVTQSVRDAIIASDKSGNIISWNKGAENIFGYSEEEVISKPISMLMPERYRNTHNEGIERVIRDPQLEVISKAVELYGLRKDLTEFPAEISLSSWLSGNKVFFSGIIRDISERKKAEKAQKIMEVKLRQTQKLEAIGQLAAGIAHEINTPIQYIGDNVQFFQESNDAIYSLVDELLGFLEKVENRLAKKSDIQKIKKIVENMDLKYSKEEVPKALRQTLSGISHVTNIVRSMKEFSHPSAKEKKLININKAIENTINVSRNEWKYVAEIKTDFDSTLPMVYCYPGELNQVFLNLIVNSAHAMDEKSETEKKASGLITIKTKTLDNFVEILIRDTGKGIPKEVQPRIFDPFFTTKEVGKGTGQGLSMAHSIIVDKHAGTIDFESEEGKGTTFIIRIPEGKD